MTLSDFSSRLLQAIQVGMVKLNHDRKLANIVEPPDPDTLTDDDWLLVLTAAGEVGQELEALGYDVKY